MIEKGLENKVETTRIRAFPYGNLARAFDELTKGMENWKDPISTKVRTREIRLYERACEFYTGSKLISGEVDEQKFMPPVTTLQLRRSFTLFLPCLVLTFPIISL